MAYKIGDQFIIEIAEISNDSKDGKPLYFIKNLKATGFTESALDGLEFYKPAPTDWSEVPIDTLVQVCFQEEWHYAYFAGLDAYKMPTVWSLGRTSITAKGNKNIYPKDKIRLPIAEEE